MKRKILANSTKNYKLHEPVSQENLCVKWRELICLAGRQPLSAVTLSTEFSVKENGAGQGAGGSLLLRLTGHDGQGHGERWEESKEMNEV